MKTLVVSVAVHNAKQWTEKFLDSIKPYPKDFHLVITDNGSDLDTRDMLKERSKRDGFELVRSEINLGFIGPHNVQFERYKDECKLFGVFNNDIILPPAWFKLMTEPFLDKDIAAVGPKALGGKLRSNAQGFNTTKDADYIEGSCAIYRCNAIENLDCPKLFDDEHIKFAYAEDSDLSMRLRETGHGIALVDMEVKHGHFVTSQEVQKTIDLAGFELRNREVFKTRWHHYLHERDFHYRVTIKRQAAAGDVFLVAGIANQIRTLWPYATITVVTACPKALASYSWIRTASAIPPDTEYFIDLDQAYEARPLMPIWEAYTEVANASLPITLQPLYAMPEPEIEEKTIKGLKSIIPPDCDKVVVLHAGPTLWTGRDWPLERWAKLASWLTEKVHAFTIAIGTGRDAALPVLFDFRGRTTTQDVAGIMSLAHLFIGVDSFPMHLAAATGIKTIALFGSIDPWLRLPQYQHLTPITADPLQVACLGCHHIQGFSRTVSYCFRRSPMCMEQISYESVQSAVKQRLDL